MSRRVTLPVVIFEGSNSRLEDVAFDEDYIKGKHIRKWNQKKNTAHTNEDWSVLSSKIGRDPDMAIIGLPVDKLLEKLLEKNIITESI